MKFWITKNAEVSVRAQIVTQIRLGVASRDLSAGEKLPSTRELARRFGIHANTVSAAYRELALESLVEFRKGSGVFVAENASRESRPKSINSLFTDFLGLALASGFSRTEIESEIDLWRHSGTRKKLVLVESDLGLRSIIEEEIGSLLDRQVGSISLDEFLSGDYDKGAVLVALFDEKEKMRPVLSPDQKAVFIDVNSVPHALIGSERPDKTKLIAVVSGWKQFVGFARIYLLAAKIDPEALIVRSTSEKGWQAGLESAAVIICDSFAAKHFPKDRRVRIFRLIKESSIEDLKHALA
ncbi:MAG: GntR family transcriptional regulator [Acidobacteria bacterium]|nr:GntR family transcriptional regulator [Acidobacteriota bacterium]